jgi:GNAT superfamily N-acetyltransferase
VEFTTDPALIVGRIEPFIAADPVLATTLGTIATLLRDPPADSAPWCAWTTDSIAVRSQRHTPVSLLGRWPDVAELVGALLELRPDGMNGPQRLVDAVLAAMAAHGVSPQHRIDERLFRLDSLIEPEGVPGSARIASETDRELLLEWWAAFAAEAHDTVRPAEVVANVDRALRSGRQWLWCQSDGTPVSMAAGRAPVAGSARVGPVYTPPELRGHGYASAVTAAVTREILAEGALPVLFTDRSNPTSNKIYRSLGYVEVDDYAFASFDWASGKSV